MLRINNFKSDGSNPYHIGRGYYQLITPRDIGLKSMCIKERVPLSSRNRS